MQTQTIAFTTEKFYFEFKIVSDLDHMFNYKSELVKIYQQKLNNIEELKKSILKKAFSGELTTNAE